MPISEPERQVYQVPHVGFAWDRLSAEEEAEQTPPLTPQRAYELYGCVCHLCRRPWLP